MSTQAISSPAVQQPAPAPAANEPKGRTWIGRQIHQAFSGITTEKVIHVTLRVLIILAIAAGVAVGVSAFVGVVTWPVGLAVFLLGIGTAVSLSWVMNRLQETRNPQYLLGMRKECAKMTLDQVIHRYGWENLIRWRLLTPRQFQEKYQQQIKTKNLEEIVQYYERASSSLAAVPNVPARYQIPAPNESKLQWTRETEAMTFEQIIQRYSVDKLEKYAIVDIGELHKIQELQRDFREVSELRNLRSQAVEQQFANATTPMREALNAQNNQAEQTYQNHPAVQGLRDFDLRCVRERHVLQQAHDVRLNALRAQLDQALARLTGNSKLTYSRLSKEVQEQFVQRQSEYTSACEQADREFFHQIQQMQTRHVAEREVLMQQEVQVRNERDQLRQNAQAQFDAATVAERQERERQLEPIQRFFTNSVRDLNQRYRAFLSLSRQ